MEQQAVLRNEVRWYHVARSRAVRRILDKSISRWAELQLLSEPHYRAYLEREGEGHLVHCQIEVVADGRTWIGSRVGQGIQQALADCLAHMTPHNRFILSEPQPAG